MNPFAWVRKVKGYLKKDVLLLVTRKKYLYTAILLPILVAGIFLLLITPGQGKLQMGLCDLDGGNLASKALAGIDGFTIFAYAEERCEERLIEDIKTGKLDLGLIIPSGFSAQLLDAKQSKLIVSYDNSDVAFANLMAWKLDSALLPFNRAILDSFNSEIQGKLTGIRTSVDILTELGLPSKTLNDRLIVIDKDLRKVESLDTGFLTSPVWVEKRPLYALSKNVGIAFIFPVLAMFLTLMLVSSSLLYDRTNQFITRVKASTTTLLYLFSKLIFVILLTIGQFLIILALFLSFGATFQLSWPGLLEMIVSVALVNGLLGILIGLVADNEAVALLFSLVVAFPLMLLSGLFFPLQTIPSPLQFIANLFPLHAQIQAVKDSLLFGVGISHAWTYLAAFLFLVAAFLLPRR